MKRKIIKIDESKCTGCGLCVPNCAEGAIQVIDGKARLISDLFCDGLGACLGHCPEGAIEIEEREAAPYEEKATMENIVKGGPNTIKAHLEHMVEHNERTYYDQAIEFLKEKGIAIPNHKGFKSLQDEHKGFVPCGCPGLKTFDLKPENALEKNNQTIEIKQKSELRNWPVQITLAPIRAPYFENADLFIASDCVSAAYPNFHSELLKNKVLLIGCPKLDDSAFYIEKLTEIFKQNNIRSISLAIMEVPCCGGMKAIIQRALMNSGKNIPLKFTIISIRGEKIAGDL